MSWPTCFIAKSHRAFRLASIRMPYSPTDANFHSGIIRTYPSTTCTYIWGLLVINHKIMCPATTTDTLARCFPLPYSPQPPPVWRIRCRTDCRSLGFQSRIYAGRALFAPTMITVLLVIVIPAVAGLAPISRPACGIRNFGRTLFVVGGSEAGKHEFPWQVSIQVRRLSFVLCVS